MKNSIIILFLTFMLAACGMKMDIVKTDKCQLRRTLKEDVSQFNFDLIIQFSKTGHLINESELDIQVNGAYLGKAVIAATTQAIETDRYVLPIRVTFPSSVLVITDKNKINVDGFLQIDGKNRPIHFEQENIYINNMTAL